MPCPSLAESDAVTLTKYLTGRFTLVIGPDPRELRGVSAALARLIVEMLEDRDDLVIVLALDFAGAALSNHVTGWRADFVRGTASLAGPGDDVAEVGVVADVATLDWNGVVVGIGPDRAAGRRDVVGAYVDAAVVIVGSHLVTHDGSGAFFGRRASR